MAWIDLTVRRGTFTIDVQHIAGMLLRGAAQTTPSDQSSSTSSDDSTQVKIARAMSAGPTVPDVAAADSFIEEAEKEASARDANDVIYSLRSSMNDYNPEPGLTSIKTTVYALNFGDDEFNPAELRILEQLMPRVPHGQYAIQPGSSSSFGHLTMAHPELWADRVATFMKELEQTP